MEKHKIIQEFNECLHSMDSTRSGTEEIIKEIYQIEMEGRRLWYDLTYRKDPDPDHLKALLHEMIEVKYSYKGRLYKLQRWLSNDMNGLSWLNVKRSGD
jgi:hypothetical protein